MKKFLLTTLMLLTFGLAAYADDASTITLRVKNVNTDAGRELMEAVSFGQVAINYDATYGGSDYATVYLEPVDDGQDVVLTGHLDQYGINPGDIVDLTVECVFGNWHVAPYTYRMEGPVTENVSLTIEPLTWPAVTVNSTAPDGLTPCAINIDGQKISGNSFEQSMLLYMSEGEHQISMQFGSGEHTFYDYGKSQAFSVSGNGTIVNYALDQSAYVGYAVTVKDLKGQPAAGFSVMMHSMDGSGGTYFDKYVRTDDNGRAAIYTMNAGQYYFTIEYDGVYGVKPYYWEENLTEMKEKPIDFSESYHRFDFTVSGFDFGDSNPQFALYWRAANPDGSPASGGTEATSYRDFNIDWLRSESDPVEFTGTVYAPDGWMYGEISVADQDYNYLTDSLKMMYFSADTRYTFDFSNHAKVNYTIDGEAYDSYSSEGRLYVFREDYRVSYPYVSGQDYQYDLSDDAYLAPGEYKAAIQKYDSENDRYYISTPVKRFVISGAGTVTVPLTTAGAEDYRTLPVEVTGYDGKVRRVGATIFYDNAFDATSGNRYFGPLGSSALLLDGHYTAQVEIFNDRLMVPLMTEFDVTAETQAINIDLSDYRFVDVKVLTDNGEAVRYYYIYVTYTPEAYYTISAGSVTGVPIGTYAAQVVTATGATYDCTLTVPADASGEVTIVLDKSTGIAPVETEAALGAVFTAAGLQVSATGSAPVSVGIYDLSGRRVMSASATDSSVVETSALPKGLYVVRLGQGKATKTLKLMK